MITKKLKHNFVFDDELKQFQIQFNHVVHYAFNRFVNSKGALKDSDVESLVKSTMNHIELLDASFIKQAVIKAKDIYKANKNINGSCDKVIFGGKSNFIKRSLNKITKEEYQEKVLLPIRVVGSKNDNGNRKFSINLKNHKIVFKRNSSHHYEIPLCGFSKKNREILFSLQDSYDKDKKSIAFTIELSKEYAYLVFDEKEFSDKEYCAIPGRTASIDMNPNYIALVVNDEKRGFLKKRVYSVKKLNDFDNRKNYSSKEDKIKWRRHLSNKKKHETIEIAKSIVELCKHYHVQLFLIEDLSIKSKDAGKGKRYNKLCLNHWQRNLLFNNLGKRCNLAGIEFFPVYAGYSSIKGQLENENEVDSIAAAIEIGKRKDGNLRDFGNTRAVFGDLGNRWKKEPFLIQEPTWKQISEFLKKKFKNSSYRNFLSKDDKNIRGSYSLNTHSSHVELYDFI